MGRLLLEAHVASQRTVLIQLTLPSPPAACTTIFTLCISQCGDAGHNWSMLRHWSQSVDAEALVMHLLIHSHAVNQSVDLLDCKATCLIARPPACLNFVQISCLDSRIATLQIGTSGVKTTPVLPDLVLRPDTLLCRAEMVDFRCLTAFDW